MVDFKGLFQHVFAATQNAKTYDSACEKIFYYLISLLKEKDIIKKQFETLSKIKKLPPEEQEDAYLALYLEIERLLITQRPVETQEAFSNKFLHGEREYTREELRKKIKRNFKIGTLSNKLKILFLEGIQQHILLYELMCEELIKGSTLANIPITIASRDLPSGIRFKGGNLDFSALKTPHDSAANREKTAILFRNLFFMLYKTIQKSGENLADEFVKKIYHFVQYYGYPISLVGTKILPRKIEEAGTATTQEALTYVFSLIVQKDLVQPQLEKFKNIEHLPQEEWGDAYLTLYLELEAFILNHTPPAVKKQFTKEDLIKTIRENVDLLHLEPRFKLLFLKNNEQIIAFFLLFTEQFLTKLSSLFEVSDLQKFIAAKTHGTFIAGIEIGKTIDLTTLERKLMLVPQADLEKVVADFSYFTTTLYKEIEHAIGEEETKKFVIPIVEPMKEKYGALPVFRDFLRNMPEMVFAQEKTASASKEAAETILEYVIQLLEKENITNQRTQFAEAKTLPPEKQSNAFFNIYLELEEYIAQNSPVVNGTPLTITSVKEDIRKRIYMEDLEDRFQILFLRPDELLMKLVKELNKECIINFIDKNALIGAERDLIKKEKLLKNVTIDDTGDFNFKPLYTNIAVKKDKVNALKSVLEKIINALFDTAKRILGEIQAKRLFETAYANLKKKYGATLLNVLKVVPKGILETEKFELLGKEQIQKTAEELTKVEMMKGEFMNIAAHELKTPLVPIISYIEMILKDKKLKPDHRKKLKVCYASAQRELLLVNDILDISKLESGTLRLELDEINLAKLLHDAAAELGPAIRQKNLLFKTQIPATLPPVRGDHRRLTQVITNLVTNATKFTEKGSITLRAEEREEDILISVTDTGMGISQENVKSLFTKFFQADTSARRKYGGTGLGLAICKGIVEGHNGKIGVKSELGKGTTFFITVPILQEKDSPKSKKRRNILQNKETERNHNPKRRKKKKAPYSAKSLRRGKKRKKKQKFK